MLTSLGLVLGLFSISWAQAPAGGDPQRGKALLLQRHDTGCILCHVVPGLPTGGDIGPPLASLSARYGADELRARIAEARQFNPQTVMPPYRSTQGLQHVAPGFKGKPVLTEQALEDIVGYLLSDHGSSRADPTPSRHPRDARTP